MQVGDEADVSGRKAANILGLRSDENRAAFLKYNQVKQTDESDMTALQLVGVGVGADSGRQLTTASLSFPLPGHRAKYNSD